LQLGSPGGGGGGNANNPNTNEMIFSCKDFRFNHGNASAGARYVWPLDANPTDDKVLTVQTTINNVTYLEWATASGSGHDSGNSGTHTGVVSGTGVDIDYGSTTGGTFQLRGVSYGGNNLDLGMDAYNTQNLRRESSTIKHKDNPRPIEIDTSKVLSLTPTTFNWKDMEGLGEEIRGVQDFGLIAEEVHEIIPELVVCDEDENPMGVRYKMISVLLLEEMKKLKARIEILEAA
jgi:hypothetical protein